jgi:hypothetical protein
VARSGPAPLDLAGDGDRRVPHLREGVLGGDAQVDVDALAAAGLRVGRVPELVEQRPHLGGRLEDLGPPDAGHRVEVDAQLVR